jgi:hypothetical protein
MLQHFVKYAYLPLIGIVCLWIGLNVQGGKKEFRYVIISDGKGYYSTLPALFIYNDLNYSFIDQVEKKHYDSLSHYEFRVACDLGCTNKYFAGTSLLQLPFFLGAVIYTSAANLPVDGYSPPFTISILIAGIFWMVIGSHYLRKVLFHFGVTLGEATFISTVMLFGSNLFYYAVVEPAMSHVYSFALITIFTNLMLNWRKSFQRKNILFGSIVLGIIIFVRPFNVIIIAALPFLWGHPRQYRDPLLDLIRSPIFFISGLIAIGIPILQLLIYKMSVDHFFLDSYPGETFNFLHPELFNFLFSYKKGLFVYLPILAIALFGWIFIYKTNKFKALSGIGFLLLLIWTLSSWWNWYYGGSFGSRVIVDFLIYFAIPLALVVKHSRGIIFRTIVIGIIVVLTLSCQLQTYQYRYYLIHWSEMNKELYWKNFMKLKS